MERAMGIENTAGADSPFGADGRGLNRAALGEGERASTAYLLVEPPRRADHRRNPAKPGQLTWRNGCRIAVVRQTFDGWGHK
jgi:hypothetical protein